jgi:HEAT repeat protein
MAQPPDPAPLRRRRAAIAGHLGEAAAARELLNDPHPSVRATALGAVARAGDLTPDDLRPALADPEPTVRRRAIEEIAALADDPDGRAKDVSLLPLLDDPDPTVVEVAAWACGERVPPEADVVAHLLPLVTDHDDPLVREAAVAALGAIGDPAGLPAILTATTDKPAVRRRAVLALAPFEGDEVDEALERAAHDRDWQVRQAAEDLTDES